MLVLTLLLSVITWALAGRRCFRASFRSSSPPFCSLRWCRELPLREGRSIVSLRTALPGKLAMIRQLSRFVISAALVALQGCGIKTGSNRTTGARSAGLQVAANAESRARRFPSVLQPEDVSSLSFEIGGQLKAVTLTVGQKVQLGDMLAEIDPRSLQTQVDQASAGAAGAGAARQCGIRFPPQGRALEAGRRDSRRSSTSRRPLCSVPRLSSTRQSCQLDLANHNLDRSKLLAPFLWHYRPCRGRNPLPRSPPGSLLPHSTAMTASKMSFLSGALADVPEP